MDRDSITRSGARTPGAEWPGPLERWCSTEQATSTLSEDTRAATECTKDGGKPWGVARGRLAGRLHLICRPSSRNGENPPYGILGRAMETSASFEARSAPLPYPTDSVIKRPLSATGP